MCHSNDAEIGDKAITRYGGKEVKIVAIEEMLEKSDEELNVDENVDVNSKAHHNYSKTHPKLVASLLHDDYPGQMEPLVLLKNVTLFY